MKAKVAVTDLHIAQMYLQWSTLNLNLHPVMYFYWIHPQYGKINQNFGHIWLELAETREARIDQTGQKFV